MEDRSVDRPAAPGAAWLSRETADAQHHWRRGARARLLRRADIARRREILELGAGWGLASEELQRRSGGRVVAVDLDSRCLTASEPCGAGIERLAADATQLPLADGTFDLVFVQFALLWMRQPKRAMGEAFRVLRPGGVLAAIEPDYGGLMEHPETLALQPIWIAALRRAGADPYVGRKLPDALARAGFRVETRFCDRLDPADPQRLAMLRGLPLTDDERARVAQIEAASRAPPLTAFLPLWLVLGEKG
jgi:SAM-dependent methyltransferase